MHFDLTAEQHAIGGAVGEICTRFDDEYWLRYDREGGFPKDFSGRLAGRSHAEAYGGSGLGVTKAAPMLETVAAASAGFSGASETHIYVFGRHPVVVHGTNEQK